MIHNIMAEFLGTALMIVFGVGVHCDEVLNKTKYRGSGHLFAITTWGFGITIVLLVFGGVCINPAMAFTQAILGMIPWNCFIPYCVAEFLGGLCGACIVYVMYADHLKRAKTLLIWWQSEIYFLLTQISEIFREISLWKLLILLYFCHQFWVLKDILKKCFLSEWEFWYGQ